ncbi:DUF4382 domain-containing protein [Flavobacteriaceae bacterium TP-CH-4]|uniref:DUF4382 domain-containing protein n=1 Tax=Pelagihabitans pacificus TaxID=2696054 RepID=A0A967E616_9FLAO|nr:DUF4382 domain-containing protein [Pelagihabitans pacificus]NHF59160.1 DUF4382 domain-containing protein [Pelagihabitans pacificus]
MKTTLVYAIFLSCTLLFINCSDDGEATGTDEMGRLTVRLTDAPFPYDLVAEANVTVFKIEARMVSEKMDSEATNDDVNMNSDIKEGSPFLVLMETDVNVNLLELTNGTTAMLADLEVPAGTYDLVRVYVKGINVVLTDGRIFDLKVPSGEQTGIKVFIKPGLIVAGGLSSDLLLDFDVSRSFVAKGSIDKVEGIQGFNFKPVIKASNLSTAGTLTGNVSEVIEEMSTALEGAQISVIAGDTLNTTAFSDVDGNYAIMGLDAGVYKVLAELNGYVSSDTLEVTLVAANKTVQDFVLEAEATSETVDDN